MKKVNEDATKLSRAMLGLIEKYANKWCSEGVGDKRIGAQMMAAATTVVGETLGLVLFTLGTRDRDKAVEIGADLVRENCIDVAHAAMDVLEDKSANGMMH